VSSARSSGRRRRPWTRIALWVVGALVVIFIVIQFVPYGRDRTDPPATNPFVWSAPAAEAVARTSCYDCHSNETKWWWAIKIAPFSWLAWHDISGGRSRLDFSDWNGSLTAEELQHAIDGEMPPLQYTLLHPDAKLTAQEKQVLLDGFRTSLAGGQGGGAGATQAPTTSASSDAVSLISERCGSCHAPDPALQYRASTAVEAQSLLDSMVQRGASLTQAEEDVLIQYYTR
jgi:hypothetical protein